MAYPEVSAGLLSSFRPDTRAKMEIVLSALWALNSNGKTVTGSLRDIQKLTGLGRGTVANALKRLCAIGWIEPVGNSRRSDWWRAAESYRLIKTPVTKPSWLWSRAGLGVTSILVLCAMDSERWMTTAQIAQGASMADRTARKYLRRMHSAGLIDWDGRYLWKRLDDDEYLNWYEEYQCGIVKRSGCRRIIEQQAEWKAKVESFQA